MVAGMGRRDRLKVAVLDAWQSTKATLLVLELPEGNDWTYESKFDGYRALAFKTGQKIRLVSRNQKGFNDNYPQLVDGLKSLSAGS
jgi:bifunctional non-homologous end joining protein LigD